MSPLENDLRAALRREEPPADFIVRVMSRTPAGRRKPRWIAAAVAACLLMGVGGFGYREYRGRKARRELLLALQITGSKLKIAQQKVLELNRKTIHD